MTKFQQIINGQVVSLSQGHMPSFFTGLDAGKPANPGKGDIYQATDTIHQYQCFVSGFWSLVYSASTIRYYNADGTITNFLVTHLGGSGSTVIDSVNARMVLHTGTTNISHAAYYALNPSIPATGGVHVVMHYPVAITLGSGTLSNMFRFGILSGGYVTNVNDSQANFAVNGNTGQWSCLTSNGLGGGQNIQTNISTPSAGSILEVFMTRFTGDVGVVLYIVNGVIVATHTQYLPRTADTVNLGAAVATGGSTVTGEMSVDVKSIGIEILY